MKCEKCDAENSANSKYCNECGEKIIFTSEILVNDKIDIEEPLYQPINSLSDLLYTNTKSNEDVQSCLSDNSENKIDTYMYFRLVTNQKLILRCGKCNHVLQIDSKIVKTYTENSCCLNNKIICNSCHNVSSNFLEFDPEYAEIKKKLDASNNHAKIGCMVVIGMIIIAIIFAFSQCSSNKSSTTVTTATQEVVAYSTGEDAIKAELKSPSTTSFPWYDTSFVTDNSDGSYSVAAYVDAENSFGAKIRSNWSCTVDSSGNVSNIIIDSN